jgi:predicted nucleic acid-binding protein
MGRELKQLFFKFSNNHSFIWIGDNYYLLWSNSTAIFDIRAARRCGQSLSIITMGTGGVIILAKSRGLISNISPGIEALRDAGLWLSDNIVNILKFQVCE